MLIEGKDYTEVIEESRFAGIHILFMSIYRSTTDITDEVKAIKYSELVLVKILDTLLKTKEIKIMPDGLPISDESKISEADGEKLIELLQSSFPKEYDQNLIEDMQYIWWFQHCPIYIGWLQDDGTYYYD
ncbi:MAG: DUF596 domain-containing protein [Candidatus Saccharibacteria bacterium]|nr:DUF596 domain-containing protein [Candidatus Saccharibacteria bacterium]